VEERGRIPVVAPVAARDTGGPHDVDDKRVA
jgi:acetylglutamate kinase